MASTSVIVDQVVVNQFVVDGTPILDVGKVASPQAVRGVGLIASTSVASVGKIPSPAAVRGADVGVTGAAPLSAGKIPSPQAVRGATLTSTTSSISLGKIASPELVRGAGLVPGPVTLKVGKVGGTMLVDQVIVDQFRVDGHSNIVRGADLGAFGLAVLQVGKVASPAAVRGVNVAPLVVVFSLGKIPSPELVRGVNAKGVGVAQLAVGKTLSAELVRGITIVWALSLGGGGILDLLPAPPGSLVLDPDDPHECLTPLEPAPLGLLALEPDDEHECLLALEPA